MSASTAWRPAAAPTGRASLPGNEWRATLVLAAREGWLIVRHPLHLAGAVLACIGPFVERQPTGTRVSYSEVGLCVVAFDGVLTFFAVHLCATRSRRSRAEDWLDAAVTSRASRTLAMCLATLAPFAIACLITAVLDPIITGPSPDPGPLRLLGSTVCVLGAGLLAVAVAQWLRFVGAPIVAMAGVFAASMWLDDHAQILLEPMTDWAQWDGTNSVNQPFIGAIPGSPAWHALYLAGLSGLALCAALLAHRRWRYRALAGAVVVAVLTVIAGSAQLP